MSDDAPKSNLLPPLGEHRPTRGHNALAESTPPTIPLELSPSPADTLSAPAEVSLELPPADPQAAPSRVARRPLRRAASLIAAGSVHVFVLLALVSTPPVEFGYGGTELDAISVSIVPASAIVARQAVADAAAPAAPSQIAPEPGEDNATSAATPEKIAPPREEAEQLPPEQAASDTSIAAPKESALEAAPDEAPEVTSPPKPPDEIKVAVAEPPPPMPIPPEKPVEDTPREEVTTPLSPSVRASAGGAMAHGAVPDQSPQPAAAAASRGEIHAYGAAVQMALLAVDQREAKARASASKAKGTVVVRLSIDDRGGLVSAVVVKSSGKAELDEAALLLIRLAAFPPPPPGLASDQRSYIAPIRFR